MEGRAEEGRSGEGEDDGESQGAITVGGIPANSYYPAEQATKVTILGGSALQNRVLGRLSPLPPP